MPTTRSAGRYCYDFNPTVAYQADMHDDDPRWTAQRKFFAGCFPGVVVGYWTVTSAPLPQAYLMFLAYILVSAGSFFAIDALTRLTASRLAALYGAVALSTFYWFGAPGVDGVVHDLTGDRVPTLTWYLRASVIMLAMVWVARTLRIERLFVRYAAQAQSVQVSADAAARVLAPSDGSGPEVTFQPQDRRIVATAGSSLLDIAEKDGLPIEAGCRMGMCGADPVAVLMPADPTIRRVVVLGNGIAGVTAAEEIRRGHPACEIHVVGREIHPLYNRMGIGRLVYGRSALAGMFLLGDDWYATRNITCWLNTRATGIDRAARQVTLGTGERLSFDRLIVATGGRSNVPTIPGVGLPGSFVLREAADAFAIRGYVQEHGATSAAVVGGGPLGIEAAHALSELGLAVHLLHRGDQLLRQYIDRQCAARLRDYLSGRGIAVVPNGDPTEILGGDRVRAVALRGGERLPVDLALVCTGLVPNVEIAAAAGITVNRGIVIDTRMRTNIAGVYAAGDVAELDGEVTGLWPTAVAQARVAARNALGDEEHLRPTPTPMLVKGIGIYLVSAGRLNAEPGDQVMVRDVPDRHAYIRLVVSAGRLAGAVILGAADEAPALLEAVEHRWLLGDVATAREGTWHVLFV